MTGQRSIPSKPRWSFTGAIVLLWLAALLLGACTNPVQPPSPLNPGIDQRLVTIRWELKEATYQGQEVEFDALRPFYLSFGWEGAFQWIAADCVPGGFDLLFEDETHYRFPPTRRAAPAVQCGEPKDTQLGHMMDALSATNEFFFEGDRLVLAGDEVRLVFEEAGAFPPFPSAERTVILNSWRWVEATDRGREVIVSALPPISVIFESSGRIVVQAGDCLVGYYLIAEQEGGGFIISEHQLTLGERCGECGTAQAVWAMSALEAATDYTLEDNRLLLSGEDVRIVLEIEKSLYLGE